MSSPAEVLPAEAAAEPRPAAPALVRRIVVADDDDDVRAALCAVLEGDHRFQVVAAVGTAGDAVSAVEREDPEIVLLDVRMPGDGIVAAHAIRATAPECVVIAISAMLDESLIRRLRAAGARGVLQKGRLGADLGDLIERCGEGEQITAGYR